MNKNNKDIEALEAPDDLTGSDLVINISPSLRALVFTNKKEFVLEYKKEMVARGVTKRVANPKRVKGESYSDWVFYGSYGKIDQLLRGASRCLTELELKPAGEVSLGDYISKYKEVSETISKVLTV